MKRMAAILVSVVTAWFGHFSAAADAGRIPYDTYSGYFVSNQFEPGAAESFLVITDQTQFDRVFGTAMVMGDKSHRLPKDVFKANVVVAAIKRGKAVWEFKVESVTETKQGAEVRYAAAAKQSDSASYACPLIVSIPKGRYTAVRFVANGVLAAVKEVAAPVASAAGAQPAISLTVLYDNYGFDDRLTANWGFACLVRGAEKTVLFDTGAKGPVLLENMAKLNVDPSRIEMLAISHDHGDHTGGLLAFLEKHGRIAVYLPPSCPAAMVDRAKSLGATVTLVTTPQEICKGVFVVGPIGDKIVEQSLAVTTRKGLVLINGCSHPGVVEMVKEANRVLKKDVYMVCGGMHLLEHSDADVKRIIAQLKELGVQKVGATHCTGDKAIRLFKEEFGDGYVPLGVGRSIEF
jgi:7,8-dihydropterin-6-yl-methyl-4-(beta-D-ribofuranosyl)aminobenzene 5'-phosphate synthase